MASGGYACSRKAFSAALPRQNECQTSGFYQSSDAQFAPPASVGRSRSPALPNPSRISAFETHSCPYPYAASVYFYLPLSPSTSRHFSLKHPPAMAVSASDCPEGANSTDCLLRDLFHAQAEWREKNDTEYDWDPITFYFTVAIAAFAALFAFIATVQAALASGSLGRRRSDYRAIGLWALKTDWSWEWSGFTFLHKTETPVLTESTFKSLLEGPSKRERRFIMKAMLSKLWDGAFVPLWFLARQVWHHIGMIFISFASFLISPFFILLVFTLNLPSFKTREGRLMIIEQVSSIPNTGFDAGFVEIVLGWIPLTLFLPVLLILLVYLAVTSPITLLGRFLSLFKLFAVSHISNNDVAAAWVGFFDKVGLGHIHPSIFVEQKQTRTKIVDYLPADVQAVPADGEVGLIILLLVLCRGHTIWANDPASGFPIVSGQDYRLQFSQHPHLGTVAVFRDGTHFPTDPGGVLSGNELSEDSFSTIQTAFHHARGSVKIDGFLGVCEDDQKPLDLASWSSLSVLLTGHTGSCKHNCKARYAWKDGMVASPSPLLLFLFAKTPSARPAVFPGNMAQPQGMLPALTMGSGFWRGRQFTASDHHALAELLGNSDQCLCDDTAASPTFWRCNLIFNACSLLAGDTRRFDSWFIALPQLEALRLRESARSLAEKLDGWLRAQSSGSAEDESGGPDVPCRASLLAMRATSFLSLARALGYDHAERESSVHGKLEEYFHEEKRYKAPDGEVTKDVEATKDGGGVTNDGGVTKDGGGVAKDGGVTKDGGGVTKDVYLKDPRLRKITEYLTGSQKYTEFQNLYHNVLPALEQDVGDAERGMTADEYRPSPEQQIDDVLILRCLLITILFRTAFDNSNLLSSGAWDQIIPIL